MVVSFSFLLILGLVFKSVNSQMPGVTCQLNYVSPTDPGFYYNIYPVELGGPVPGFHSDTLREIAKWQYFYGNSLEQGTTTRIGFDLPNQQPNDTVVYGFLYGNFQPISNFTMEAMGWLIAPETGYYNFSIETDTAAELYIANNTDMYCTQNPNADMADQFQIGSYSNKSLIEPSTGSVFLLGGIPYEVELSYIHLMGAPKLSVSVVDPQGVYHPDLTFLMQEFNIYNSSQLVTGDYELVNATTTIGWSGNSTTLLSVTSSATEYSNTLTVTSIYVYGTPTPHVQSSPTYHSHVTVTGMASSAPNQASSLDMSDHPNFAGRSSLKTTEAQSSEGYAGNSLVQIPSNSTELVGAATCTSTLGNSNSASQDDIPGAPSLSINGSLPSTTYSKNTYTVGVIPASESVELSHSMEPTPVNTQVGLFLNASTCTTTSSKEEIPQSIKHETDVLSSHSFTTDATSRHTPISYVSKPIITFVPIVGAATCLTSLDGSVISNEVMTTFTEHLELDIITELGTVIKTAVYTTVIAGKGVAPDSTSLFISTETLSTTQTVTLGRCTACSNEQSIASYSDNHWYFVSNELNTARDLSPTLSVQVEQTQLFHASNTLSPASISSYLPTANFATNLASGFFIYLIIFGLSLFI